MAEATGGLRARLLSLAVPMAANALLLCRKFTGTIPTSVTLRNVEQLSSSLGIDVPPKCVRPMLLLIVKW